MRSNLFRLGIAAMTVAISSSAMAANPQNIQKKMNNVLQNCNDTLQSVAGEFYATYGYFPGGDLSTPSRYRQVEYDALEKVINRCMQSKFVGGANFITLSDADLADWENALTTNTVKISYPSITVEIDGEEQVVEGMQMDVLLGGAKKRPNGQKTQNIAQFITKGIPSQSGKVSFLLTSNNYAYGQALNYCGYQIGRIGFTGTTYLGNVRDKHFPRRCQANNSSPFIDKAYAIKDRVDSIVNTCSNPLKKATIDFYATEGYLLGSPENPSYIQDLEKEFLQNIVNNCMLSKYVGGEFVDLDTNTYESNWDGAQASSSTVQISYPQITVNGDGYTVDKAIQIDISIGGSETMPTGENVLNISNKITSGVPSSNGEISVVLQLIEDGDDTVISYEMLCGNQVAEAGYDDKTTVAADLLPNSCK